MKIKLGRIQRLELRIFGKTYIGMKKKPGWKDKLPFYVIRCPVHGLVEDYLRGWKTGVSCSECTRANLEDRK